MEKKNKGMTRTVFSKSIDRTPNPTKQWFGTYEVENTNYIVDVPFETTTRSTAVEWLENYAKRQGGRLSTVNAKK